MSKYDIKNCPAFVLMRTATSGTYFNMCGNAKGHIKCADCTDCAMKQIVELCKNKDYFVKRFPDTQFSSAVQNSELAFEILQLLDIQEVE